MIIACLIVAIALAKLRGGQFGALVNMRLAYSELLLVAVVVQLLGVVVIRPHSVIGGALAMLSGFVVLLIVAWSNRKLPGVYIIMLGFSLNTLVIAANGGTMPTTPAVVRAIGRADELTSIEVASSTPAGSIQQAATATVANTKAAISPDPKLIFLGDVIVIPLPGRFASAVSIGDIIIAVGLIPLCGWAMGVVKPSGNNRDTIIGSHLVRTRSGLLTSLFSKPPKTESDTSSIRD